jgi:glycosyltransferase involved in cell wall biosynthesis
MRLLYLSADPGVPVFGGKGASIHVRSMVGGFAGLGHEVIVASPRLEPGDEELPGSARTAPIPAVRPRSAPSEAEVVRQIEAQTTAVEELAAREEVDGIYERYSLSSCAGARVSRALSLPLIVEVNAPLRAEERRFRELAHEELALAAEQETFAAATLLVAVSPWLRDWLVGAGVPAHRVQTIPNPAPRRAPADRRDLGAGEPLWIGFSGSLKPWHGVETLIEAFQRALDRGADLRLEIVGDGPLAGAVQAGAAQCPRITWLGHLPHAEVLERLKSWDVGVAPYIALEDFYFSPLKLGEYMAAGLCPVVSRIGPLPEMVQHGRCGVLVAPGDPEALADALMALDHDRARVRELGRHAQALASQGPTWHEVAGRVCAAFEQVAAPVDGVR